MKTTSRHEFHCPKCGGYTFGTRGAISGPIEDFTGYCFGGPNEDNGCKFAWPRSEDWKYFVKITVERCESKAEFEKGSAN